MFHKQVTRDRRHDFVRIALLGLMCLMFPTLGASSTSPSGVIESHTRCAELVDKFLAAPDSAKLFLIEGSDREACWQSLRVSDERMQSLLRLVAGGNESSARFLARHLSQLDGGDLEDSLIAIGQFSDLHMETFLNLVAPNLLSVEDLKSALTMLPLDVADEPATQLAMMKARRNKVATLDQVTLTAQKKVALCAIDTFIAEIEASIRNTPPEQGE